MITAVTLGWQLPEMYHRQLSQPKGEKNIIVKTVYEN
jgi:hypothetical protein